MTRRRNTSVNAPCSYLTTLAQLAAKATQLGTQVAVSPAALSQRMNTRALTFLRN